MVQRVGLGLWSSSIDTSTPSPLLLVGGVHTQSTTPTCAVAVQMDPIPTLRGVGVDSLHHVLPVDKVGGSVARHRTHSLTIHSSLHRIVPVKLGQVIREMVYSFLRVTVGRLLAARRAQAGVSGNRIIHEGSGDILVVQMTLVGKEKFQVVLLDTSEGSRGQAASSTVSCLYYISP